MTNRARPPADGQLPLFAAGSDTVVAAVDAGGTDAEARQFAADPRHHVVLEASAGTGKTSVLVARYVTLLRAGIHPENILAITFTRKAAAEMRERIVRELREAAARSEIDRVRWLELRDRLGEIAISTIDAFCLSLLREFPLEADLDPGFDMADEMEVPRLVDEALDRALRIFTTLARTDEDVALVLAQLGIARTREGLATLIDRRLVAWDALDRFLARGPKELTAEVVCRRAVTAVQDVLRGAPGGLPALLADGPAGHPRYQLLLRDVARLPELEQALDDSMAPPSAEVPGGTGPGSGAASTRNAAIRGVLGRVAAHFLTIDGSPRRSGSIHPYKAADYPSAEAARRHRAAVFQLAPHVERVLFAFACDLNVVLARGIRKMFAIALEQYRRALDERSVLDFADVLQRALELLRQMDEFAQSRFRLEARYHHVLVDEFQDTSRAQWELIALLIQSWREGAGLPSQPSIFIVGDRKQSIYRFRDAEVSVLQQAARHIEALRPGGSPRRAITRSFRAVPELLRLVNAVFGEIAGAPVGPSDFVYDTSDRFPIEESGDSHPTPVLGIAAADDPLVCAAAVAGEITRILREDTVRDRQTGVRRPASPGDIAILFRSRTSHREFQRELELRGVPAYVYKGLGFFDADETKDLVALIRFLADPTSDLRAAAFLRSRFVRISDEGLARLAPHLASAVTSVDPSACHVLDDEDRGVLEQARRAVAGWLAMADRVPPADLIDEILFDSAYAYELRGPRQPQAWENIKKFRGLVRRVQNRGYATLARLAEHLDSLTAGDESNAVLEALDAVNLMTVHASKGLEFPIVFVVNMARGASGPPRPVRVIVSGDDEPSVSVGPFVSDTEEADRERERHETRRLLYVAFTRARDRLYLASALKDGALVPGRGSLAEVLPESIRGLFASAAAATEAEPFVNWSGPSGEPFVWRVCRPALLPEPSRPSAQGSDQRPECFGRLEADGLPRQSVADWLAEMYQDPPGSVALSDVTVGRLVHRLLESSVQLLSLPAGEHAGFARGLLTDAERAVEQDIDLAVSTALAAWEAWRGRTDVAELFADGEHFHEVPFSLREESRVLRGTIDCLIRRADGSVTVAEFKTGAPRDLHRAQLGLYVRAVQALFPDAPVDGRLFYL